MLLGIIKRIALGRCHNAVVSCNSTHILTRGICKVQMRDHNNKISVNDFCKKGVRCLSDVYEQGRVVYSGARRRERRLYFYYVEHDGRLFLDDTKIKNFTSCLKDKVFLQFFFSRIRKAKQSDPGFNEYAAAFPWVSPCGPELNYIRCDDTPIVYDNFEKCKGVWYLSYGGKSFSVPFEPRLVTMSASSGRMYYPHQLTGNALISSPIAVEIGANISEESDGSLSLMWEGTRVSLELCP
eukprot:m.271292 g.271292  ORF g.271292 m.271292 type:complete len:239 (-) comp16268_c1_seq23:1605-2321(-)